MSTILKCFLEGVYSGTPVCSTFMKTEYTLSVSAFWEITRCSLAEIYRRLRYARRLHYRPYDGGSKHLRSAYLLRDRGRNARTTWNLTAEHTFLSHVPFLYFSSFNPLLLVFIYIYIIGIIIVVTCKRSMRQEFLANAGMSLTHGAESFLWW